MLIDELVNRSAVELAALIRTRKVSPVEVMRGTLAQIERLNPLLNAFVTVQAEEALCSAAKAEEALRSGQPTGPLYGVPLHVKDNLFVAGSRTTFGSKLLETNVTSEDCPAVDRRRETGTAAMDAVHLSVQPDWPTRRQRSRRLDSIGIAGGTANHR
ncbi:MAG: amidase family protein [Planctomycetaceae bacterium]